MKRSIVLLIVLAAWAGPASASAPSPPVNTSAPVVSGQPYVGKTLTTSNGGWKNSPTSFSYQWVRCDQSGNGCAQISGATSKSYTVAAADVNHTLAAWVQAANSGGTSGPVTSKTTDPITPALPPTLVTQPSITGKPLVGEKLLANPGTYSGGAITSYGYEWQRCNLQTVSCTDISGATSQTYTAASADVGQRLKVIVTARNPFGHVSNAAVPTDAVTVPVVTVTTTLTASSTSTVCCQKIRLSGTTSPATSGEKITILALQYGDIAAKPVTTATTDANGNWSVTVTPMIGTTYTAQTSTSTSSALKIVVHPRIGFGITGHVFSAKVTGLGSFAGSVGWLERLTPSGGWRRIGLVVINQLSIARFHVHLPRGHMYTLRIYLPAHQAGPGYLDGSSHARRIAGFGA
jgi:hypothetical protein